jgi:hypothetical protein
MRLNHVQREQTTPRVFAEFMLIGERTEIGLSVPVVPEADVTLTEGERVILTDYTDLWSEGTLAVSEQGGRRYWYGKLGSRTDIHDIDEQAMPTDQAPQRQTTGASQA